jgi:hypothetical protein
MPRVSGTAGHFVAQREAAERRFIRTSGVSAQFTTSQPVGSVTGDAGDGFFSRVVAVSANTRLS